jgi:ribosome biogenesis GTPase
MTIVQPNLKQGFIDRFLLMTEPFNIPTAIIFNKTDLYSPEDFQMADYLCTIYNEIGYTTLLVSSTEGQGVEEARELFKGKRTLISGQSGVGKSTLINAITGDLLIRTKELSDYSGKGQHTTTFAEMYPLSFGGDLVDTPGIKTLSFNYLEPIDIAHNFREFFALSVHCRFGGNCLHRSEPGCAVKDALEEQIISELRYLNYLTLIEEAEGQNYWERQNV